MGRQDNPVLHLHREKRKNMGRQRILYYISIEKRGKTWEDRESYVTSLQRKEEIHGKTENHMSHLYREKRKYMGRQRILCLISIEKRGNTWEDKRILYYISIEKRGNTWEDRESYVTSLQIEEEIHGKTENPKSHLCREKRKYMGRQRILCHISIEKEEIHGKTRESCITSLQRKEEIHGKTENHMSHLYREKRKYMGRQRILCHISIEKRGNTWEDKRILYYISIEKRGKTWEDRESCITSLQIKEEIHGKTENPISHLYREKRKYMGRQRILYYISIEKRGNSWEDRESYVTSLQIKEEIHGKTENPKSHLYREKRKYMGRQRILCHISIEKRGNTWEDKRILYYISIEKRGNTWEDRESYITSLQRKEEIHGKTDNPVLHLYREKRKFMGRERIMYYIFIEKRGNTWEDRESYVTSLQRKEEIHGKTRESCITSLQRKEEKHGKTENPVSHLYREKWKFMGRQRIICHISIEKRGNTWEDRESYVTSLQRKEEIHGKTRESCITSLQRKEEIHGKTENPKSHLYREKRKYMGRQDNPVLHLYREKRKNMGRQRILYYISIEKRGKTWEDRESCITSLQRKEEKHGKTENPVLHLYREKRKNMGRQRILYYISIEKRGKTWEDRESCITSLQRKEEIHGKTR